MKDYGKGKIYTIRCRTDDTLIYVGSTVQPLSKRLGNHKADSKREKCKNYLIYKTINGDWNNWHIELHSLYPCNSKEELERKEGEIIREIGTLNVVINGRTQKEWHEDNKEHMKAYREANKERDKERDKEWYEKNKEARKTYVKANKEQIKETKKVYDKEQYEKNKEKKKAYSKAYYEKKKALKNNIHNI